MKAKRILAVLMAAALTVGMSACAGDSGSSSGGSSTGGESSETPKEIIELNLVTMGTAPESGLDTFYEKLDALTEKDLGVRVRVDYIAWGEEGTKIPLAITGGDYDLIIGGPWSGFSDMAVKNAFVDLNQYLDEVPDLVEHYGAENLKMAEIGGKLYGIFQRSDVGGGNGMLYREDLRKKWGLEEITDLESMEAYFYAAKENGYAYSINDSRIGDFLWELMTADKYETTGSVYYVASKEDPYTPLLKYELPEYKEMLEYTAKWMKDGIIKNDILTGQGGQKEILMQQDQLACEVTNHLASVNSTYVNTILDEHPEWELGFMQYQLAAGMDPMYLPTVSTTVYSVSSQSEHPLEALKFLEKAHTDPEYAKLVLYGVEGVNYEMDGEYIDTTQVEETFGITGFGDRDNELKAKQKYESWGKVYDSINEQVAERSTVYSPYEGFTFNTENLKSETAALETVKSQYVIPLECGSANVEADLETAIAELKKAGVEKVGEELASQLKTFSESK